MLEGMKTQSRMRRFCKRHYLSYNRMREWRDIHVQLRQTVREIGGFRWNREDADYDAIHRSILSGLLSNIAQKMEHNLYRGARGRDVVLFPGSGLLSRKASGSEGAESRTTESRTPGWMVAAEIVVNAILSHLLYAMKYLESFYDLYAATYKVSPFFEVFEELAEKERKDWNKEFADIIKKITGIKGNNQHESIRIDRQVYAFPK